MNTRGRGAGRGRKSGWHKTAFMAQRGETMNYPVVPTAWDDLLRELGLDDDAALREVKLATAVGHKLRAWVDGHYRRYFVPEQLLKLLGLDALLNVLTEAEREQISIASKRSHELRRLAKAARLKAGAA